jgi:hypothetical protein
VIKNLRLWAFWIAAIAVITWYWTTDPDKGADTIARLQWLAWMVVAAGPVYLLRRAFFDKARSKDAYDEAMKGNIGAGLAFLGLCILTGLLFFSFAIRSASGQDLPEPTKTRAVAHIKTLQEEQKQHWPDMPIRSTLAAQVEQETCPSLKSSKCWNPKAELKTAREYGFGLGQLTVTQKFDNFEEARKLDSSLRDWKWEERYDARKQLRTMILMDKGGYQALTSVPDARERLAMTYSAYNGGLGGLRNDRRLCGMTEGCDPKRWFGHVEKTSTKSKTKTQGYGQSMYDINRDYVRNVMINRRVRYSFLD